MGRWPRSRRAGRLPHAQRTDGMSGLFWAASRRFGTKQERKSGFIDEVSESVLNMAVACPETIVEEVDRIAAVTKLWANCRATTWRWCSAQAQSSGENGTRRRQMQVGRQMLRLGSRQQAVSVGRQRGIVRRQRC